MDPTDGRARGRGRGLARGQSQPVRQSANLQGPPTQPGNPRFAGPRPTQSRPVGINMPRVPGPKKPRFPVSSSSSTSAEVINIFVILNFIRKCFYLCNLIF